MEWVNGVLANYKTGLKHPKLILACRTMKASILRVIREISMWKQNLQNPFIVEFF
jgi:hypothetical protein